MGPSPRFARELGRSVNAGVEDVKIRGYTGGKNRNPNPVHPAGAAAPSVAYPIRSTLRTDGTKITGSVAWTCLTMNGSSPNRR